MSILSVFVDESGDFGEYAIHSPYYIISLVFHNQSDDITDLLDWLESTLSHKGYPDHCVHVAPLIRGEEEYRNAAISERKTILRNMMAFFRRVKIRYKSFHVEKKHIENEIVAAGKLGKQISIFIREHMEYFQSFDKVIIYYDNGQIQINTILSSVFNVFLENVEFRKVIPAEYRLFQLADLTCSLQLVRLKTAERTLSRSELYFFENERTLVKQYFRLMDLKEMK